MLRAGSCAREANRRGLGQMFPFTNTAKEPGMPSSLPWCYLHFTTSSNNHATSSLKKENTAQRGNVSPPTFIKGAKMKSFFYSSSETLPCFILPTVIQTGYQHPEPCLQDGLELITRHCHFARGLRIRLLLGHQGWLIVQSLNLLLPFSRINQFLI